MKRPRYGEAGAEIKLTTNLLDMQYPTDIVIRDYRITIEPDVYEAVDLRRTIVSEFVWSQEMSKYLRDIAHDGIGRLVSRLPFPRNFKVLVTAPALCPSDVGERTENVSYSVTLIGPKELRSLDLKRYVSGQNHDYNPHPIISALNLILAAHATRSGFRALTKNANYFEPIEPNEGASATTLARIKTLSGFFASVHPVSESVVVNVNVCSGTFHKPGSMVDALLDLMQHSEGVIPQEFFGNMQVVTNYLGYERRNTVKAIGPGTARSLRVRYQGSIYISLEEYFLKKFNICLRHADDLPVVIVEKKGRDIFFPAELCDIVQGTLFTGKLEPEERKALRVAHSKTTATNAQTFSVMHIPWHGLEGDCFRISSFGLKISSSMKEVSARVLPAPAVEYASGRPQVINGSWTTRGIQFARPAQLMRLVVVLLEEWDSKENDGQLEVLIRKQVSLLLLMCRASGMIVDMDFDFRTTRLRRPSRDDPYRDSDIGKVLDMFRSLQYKPEMVFALVSNRDKNIYAGLHRSFDVVQGVRSLFGLIDKMKEGQHQYLIKLALKINAKLGGLNHRIQAQSLKRLKHTMVAGFCMVRSGEDTALGTPGIAAVAASCDKDFSQYHASVSLQRPNKEEIENLQSMMTERLKDYQARTNTLPKRIVVFRTGISEGQYVRVMKAEIKQVKDASKAFRSYTPRLTYIACSRSHRIKFHSVKAEDTNGTTNAPPGTVVDSDVTSIYNFDFYLQTHAGGRCAASPTHYTVICDENRFTRYALQQSINDISYLWVLSANSVNLVPPAYWAKKACARARLYVHKVISPAEGGEWTRTPVKDAVKELWRDGVHDALKNSMFYI